MHTSIIGVRDIVSLLTPHMRRNVLNRIEPLPTAGTALEQDKDETGRDGEDPAGLAQIKHTCKAWQLLLLSR